MWCIDILAKRYGWGPTEIKESMYWEELVDYTKYAANSSVAEENAARRFDFMLHADKKSKNKWKDAPLPFENKPGTVAPKASLADQLKGLPAKYRINQK